MRTLATCLRSSLMFLSATLALAQATASFRNDSHQMWYLVVNGAGFRATTSRGPDLAHLGPARAGALEPGEAIPLPAGTSLKLVIQTHGAPAFRVTLDLHDHQKIQRWGARLVLNYKAPTSPHVPPENRGTLTGHPDLPATTRQALAGVGVWQGRSFTFLADTFPAVPAPTSILRRPDLPSAPARARHQVTFDPELPPSRPPTPEAASTPMEVDRPPDEAAPIGLRLRNTSALAQRITFLHLVHPLFARASGLDDLKVGLRRLEPMAEAGFTVPPRTEVVFTLVEARPGFVADFRLEVPAPSHLRQPVTFRWQTQAGAASAPQQPSRLFPYDAAHGPDREVPLPDNVELEAGTGLVIFPEVWEGMLPMP